MIGLMLFQGGIERENMKKVYNKLVRDRIPEIIREKGQECVTEILSDEEYINALDEKLREEMEEYQLDKSIDELSDLLEVVYSVANARGWSVEELEGVRKNKADKRGGFEKRIFLREVKENNIRSINKEDISACVELIKKSF